MNNEKAFIIISALADGINPVTGNVFPEDSPYHAPDVVRALFLARTALEGMQRKSRDTSPANAGKPWTAEEDAELLERFDRGLGVNKLAQKLGRTRAGIQARLERHGRVCNSTKS